MLFCTNCGEKITEESTFCQNCGEKLNVEQPTQVPDTRNTNVEPISNVAPQPSAVEETPTMLNKPKTPMSMAKKIIIGVVVAIVALAFGAKYFIDQKFDPQNQLKEMHQAFTKEDRKAFYSYFEFPEGTIGGEDEFYEWVDEAGWSNVRESIEEQLNRFEKGKSMDAVEILYEDALRLKEEKALFGLAKKVTYTIRPLELEIEANADNTTMTIEDVNLKVSTEAKTVGKFLPGIYDTEYLIEGPYMDVEGELEMYVYPYEYDKYAYFYYEMDFATVELYSDRDSAMIYINDKSIGKKVNELNVIYPISYASKASVYLVDKDTEGNEIQSEKYILDDEEIYIEFPYDQELEIKDTVVEYYKYFREEFMDANNYANFDYISYYFEEDTQIYKDYKKFVEDHEAIDYYWYTPISNEVTKVEKISDNEYMLYTTEEFDFETTEETVNYVREKSYKIKFRDNDSAVFTEIKDLNTKKTNK